MKFAVNGFVIACETKEAAIQVLQETQGKADKDAVEAFGDAVKNAGQSASNNVSMWANLKVQERDYENRQTGSREI
jgi:hypothetical protein